VIAGKGATNLCHRAGDRAAFSKPCCTMKTACCRVSSLLSNYHGMDDVCLSVPCIVNRAGVEAPLPIPLNPAELADCRTARSRFKQTIRSLRVFE